jgi:hypothetical protein
MALARTGERFGKLGDTSASEVSPCAVAFGQKHGIVPNSAMRHQARSNPPSDAAS